MFSYCAQCGARFEVSGQGRIRRTCSSRCRQALYRSRKRERGGVELLRSLSVGRWVRCVGKRPVMVDGSAASSTNPDTWASFESVQRGAGDGFGVMLGDGLGCYDLDHCVDDGRLLSWAADFVSSIPERVVFSELSVSGTGVHVFFVADSSGRGTRRNGVERYTQSRFIRTTLRQFDI